MKFAVFLCISLQLYVANSKSLTDLLRPCRKSDPNLNSCVLNLFQRGITILAKGAPEYFIPPMDPFVIPVFEKNITIANLAEGNIVLKHVKISNILNVKVSNVKIDLDNHQGEIDLYHPQIKVSLQYSGDGKLFDTSMHSEGLFKGKFNDIKCNIKLKLKPIEKRGVKYFALEDFKLNTHVGGGYIDIVANDPEQQPIIDFVQNLFNQDPRPYLDVFNPIIVETAESHIRKLLGGILAFVPANAILPD
ncbi:hypothetical protein ILUMI_20022 [Ignelater luminosus]|uniref:Uncharacterized protein n=1 Tax=Ignelater luminosus TaxID=2038154 RepID=A0A8K0CLR5_IGNLU|nr:hypothetical protein ILUMI_20022 [Ignelater luminosus]